MAGLAAGNATGGAVPGHMGIDLELPPFDAPTAGSSPNDSARGDVAPVSPAGGRARRVVKRKVSELSDDLALPSARRQRQAAGGGAGRGRGRAAGDQTEQAAAAGAAGAERHLQQQEVPEHDPVRNSSQSSGMTMSTAGAAARRSATPQAITPAHAAHGPQRVAPTPTPRTQLVTTGNTELDGAAAAAGTAAPGSTADAMHTSRRTSSGSGGRLSWGTTLAPAVAPPAAGQVAAAMQSALSGGWHAYLATMPSDEAHALADVEWEGEEQWHALAATM